MPVAFDDFSHTFSIRAKGAQHASKLEHGALCLSVKTIVRQVKWHGHRIFALVDSLALMFAVRKGRSSAPNFRFGSRVLATNLLAADLQLHVGYTPSRFNPSDEPSRGVLPTRVGRCGPRSKGSHCQQSLVLRTHLLKRSVCRLVACGHLRRKCALDSWSSSCSSSCLTQPSHTY